MQVQRIQNNNYAPKFGIKFKLTDELIKALETTSNLSYEELQRMPLFDVENPSKLKGWIANQYRKIGESLGFIEKQYNIYTDID